MKLALSLIFCIILGAALSCPEGWSCAEGIAARGAEWRIVPGNLVVMEAIFTSDETENAKLSFNKEINFEDLHGNVTAAVHTSGIPALKDLDDDAAVDLAFIDNAPVAMRPSQDRTIGPAARGYRFTSNNLISMSKSTYQSGAQVTMRVLTYNVKMGSADAPCSEATVKDLLTGSTSKGSVKQVYTAMSNGNVVLSVTYGGTIDIGAQPNNCDVDTWVSRMDAKINWSSKSSSYDYRWYFLPKKACRWAGLAHVSPSCTNCWALNNLCMPMVPTHEGGHNQGLNHSGQQATYDDHSDYMGNAAQFRLMNAVKKLRMGYVLPSKINWNPGYGVYMLSSLDVPYKSAPRPQVMLFQSSGVANTIALRSRPNAMFDLPSKYNNLVNLVDFRGKESKFLGAVGSGSISIPGTNKRVIVGRIASSGGVAQTAFVSVCVGTSCPPYQFKAMCQNGSAVQKCMVSNRYYPDWYCRATGSPTLPSSKLGAGKSCINGVAGQAIPTANPPR